MTWPYPQTVRVSGSSDIEAELSKLIEEGHWRTFPTATGGHVVTVTGDDGTRVVAALNSQGLTEKALLHVTEGAGIAYEICDPEGGEWDRLTRRARRLTR